MSERPSTDYTNEITCPYCSYEFTESYEYHDSDGDEVDCPECEKKFELSVDVSVTYSTKRLDCEDDAHEFDEAQEHRITQATCDRWNAGGFLNRHWGPHSHWSRSCKNCDHCETTETEPGAPNPFEGASGT